MRIAHDVGHEIEAGRPADYLRDEVQVSGHDESKVAWCRELKGF